MRPYLKNKLKQKRLVGMAPEAGHLSNKYKALTSNPSTEKKIKVHIVLINNSILYI
jgi:hypothetical protein